MKKFGKAAIGFLKKDTVLCIALLLAVISAFAVRPDSEYAGYIDCKVLVLLFCLMAVVCGFRELGVFKTMAEFLLGKVKTYRQLLAVLLFLCFFTAMLITNDVALITFVPFTVMILQMIGRTEKLACVVVLQTIAANLGSMFTPIGNPQNLYIYERAQMNMGSFLLVMLPLTAASFLLLLLFCLFSKSKVIELKLEPGEKADRTPKEKVCFALYTVLFVLSILTVLRLLHYGILLAATLLVILLFKRELLKQVDYSLLITFVGFFIFIGNIGRIEAFRSFLERIITGRELLLGFLSSQVMSNLPATVLLSEFTRDWAALLWGVNIGGLGTLIASMASVISFKLYGSVPEMSKGRYLALFTGYSLIFAAVLLPIAYGLSLFY